ncbi:hypothetical protein KIN20_015885 [Parelaphostrongylus tenuis]|uniref:Uncharacterized protein n=1 Tax=Parelaphostrongylus tenuis TaxID=148309 RepID=A0AAD5N0T8_PARTN|nr:hypothetical protein KIN20_015885 [Parelaphostrongylus tenuis]
MRNRFHAEVEAAEELLGHIPAHLTNTQILLDRLRNANPNNAYVMESCLYTNVIRRLAPDTNVSNDSALQATHELLIQH